MKKRILSAAMASVMALGSVAVVASAEEVTTAEKNVKTKADLETLVKSLAKFREVEMYEYGTLSAERFEAVMNYADGVLADEKATVDDYTVTYHMITATKEKLKIYTSAELRALLAKGKQAYESENIYNSDLGDAIYDTEKYDVFADAYEDAESVLESSDSHLITDCYEELEKAFNDLTKLDVVTKSQFTSVIKQFEQATMNKYKYDSWITGKFADEGEIPSDTYDNYAGKRITWGGLYSLLDGERDTIYDAYHAITSIKSASKTSNEEIVKGYYLAADAVKLFNLWTVDDTTRGSKSGVTSLLKQYHNVLAYDYNNVSANELFNAVKKAATPKITVDYAASTANKDTAVVIQVEKYNESGYSTDWYDVLDVADGWLVSYDENEITDLSDSKLENKLKVYKNADAAINIKANTTLYIPVNSDNMWTGEPVLSEKPATTTGYKTITKGRVVNLLDFIGAVEENVMEEYVVDNSNVVPVTTGAAVTFVVVPNKATNNATKNDILDGGADVEYVYEDGTKVEVAYDDLYNTVDLGVAYNLVQLYNSGNKDAIKDDSNPIYAISSSGEIAKGTASGSAREWMIIYNYLKRALEDKYSLNATTGTYTRTDVVNLLEYAYDLSDKTGDIALFHEDHMALVDARQVINTWLSSARASKTYKDNVTVINGMVSTQAYNYLKKICNKLEDDMKAFSYSYGDIYNYVSDIYAEIDEGKIKNVEGVKVALEDVLYKLVTVEDMDSDFDLENAPFTDDGEFNAYNRVFTYGKAYKFGTIELPAPADSSVIKSHDDLAKAFENLKKIVEEDKTVVKGDMSGDGVVNALDASLILKAIVDGKTADIEVAKGDYNSDGAVNALDASAILQAIVNGIV